MVVVVAAVIVAASAEGVAAAAAAEVEVGVMVVVVAVEMAFCSIRVLERVRGCGRDGRRRSRGGVGFSDSNSRIFFWCVIFPSVCVCVCVLSFLGGGGAFMKILFFSFFITTSHFIFSFFELLINRLTNYAEHDSHPASRMARVQTTTSSSSSFAAAAFEKEEEEEEEASACFCVFTSIVNMIGLAAPCVRR